MNGYEKRTQQKRNDILNAAFETISLVPIQDISIQDIAKRAHVSHVTIYNLFGSKASLLDEAAKECADHDIKEILDVLKSDSPVQKRLRLYFAVSFQHSVDRPQFQPLMNYIFHDKDSSLYKYVTAQYAMTVPYLEKLYDDGQKAGIIRPSLTAQQFMKLLDICTRINRRFLLDDAMRETITDCVFRCFS